MNEQQLHLCEQYGAIFDPPAASSRVGIALQTLHLQPLHGMRVAPHGDACGWYLWGGEYSENPDFFQPCCIDHMPVRCPVALRFLALPPGWRFLTDGSIDDVWYDEALKIK